MIEAKYIGPHKPPRVGKQMLERFWQDFLKHGSNHSGQGMLLSLTINRCEAEKVPYRLTAYPGQGYFIEPIPPLLQEKSGGPAPPTDPDC